MPQDVYFRVDIRPFKKDDIIEPVGMFMEKHLEKGVSMEELIRSAAPAGMPERKHQLFVFEDEDCARYHMVKTSGGRLYRVTLGGEIVHRGDMKLLDQIGETQDETERKKLADQYWKGEQTPKPCTEVMVPTARVVKEIILSTADRRDMWAKNGFTRPDLSDEAMDDIIFGYVQRKQD